MFDLLFLVAFERYGVPDWHIFGNASVFCNGLPGLPALTLFRFGVIQIRLNPLHILKRTEKRHFYDSISNARANWFG